MFFKLHSFSWIKGTVFYLQDFKHSPTCRKKNHMLYICIMEGTLNVEMISPESFLEKNCRIESAWINNQLKIDMTKYKWLSTSGL